MLYEMVSYETQQHRKWALKNRERIRMYSVKRREEDREKYNAYHRAYRKKNWQKAYARRAVVLALKRGDIKKKPCFCGDIEVEAHHDDYDKPLKVKWRCKRHHEVIHMR